MRMVKEISRLGDARESLRAFLPFQHKTGSFGATRLDAVTRLEHGGAQGVTVTARSRVTGEMAPHSITFGQMLDADRRILSADLDALTAAGGNAYIVYSYETPIAWTRQRADGSMEVHMPEVVYSPTTARHQDIVRRAYGLGARS